MDWICSRDIEENMAELSTWRFQVKTESNFENSNEQVYKVFEIFKFFIWYFYEFKNMNGIFYFYRQNLIYASIQ